MPGGDYSGRHEDVACPFCGLLCDDLVIENAEGRLTVRSPACGRSREAFERAPVSTGPTVDGKAVVLAAAVAATAERLAGSKLPLFAGLGADVEGVRAILDLADRCGGAVDHMHADGLFRNLEVMTGRGWMVTTLSEVRNRADLALIVGPDPRERYPRFYERCLGDAPTLFSDRPLQRRIVRLGPPAVDEPGVELIACETERLPEATALLRALLADPDREIGGNGLPLDALRALARDLPDARYGVIAWAAGAFADPWGALVIETLCEMVRTLNGKTRFSGLPLSGDDNVIGANQVITWQSGLPLRSGFARGYPEHDATRFAAERMLDDGEADLLIWISAFQPAPPPGRRVGLPTIVLATPGGDPPEAEIVIPVGTPGIDHAGRMFRSDSVVALPLRALRDSELPSVADVAGAIMAALNRGDGAPRS